MRRGTNKDVAHSWAHQHADTSAASFMHRGPELISYGTTIGWHFGDFVLLSRDSFSMTTASKHLSPTFNACRHLRIIKSGIFRYGLTFDNPPTPDAILDSLEEQFTDLLKLYPRKRNKGAALEQLQAIHADAEYVAAHLGGTMPETMQGVDWSNLQAEAEKVAEVERQREETRRQNEEKALQKRREEDAQAYASFLQGDTSHCPSSYRTVNGSHSLTIRPFIADIAPVGSEAEVVTSDGAHAPLSDVQTALHHLDALRESGLLPWKRNGEKIQVGGYQIDRIDADGGVHAGCHFFSAEEIERFRKAWGL